MAVRLSDFLNHIKRVHETVPISICLSNCSYRSRRSSGVQPHQILNSPSPSISMKANDPIAKREVSGKPGRNRSAMERMTHKDPFAVMSAAVMHSPKGKPIFREIAYCRDPYSKSTEQRIRVWRINTPHSFVHLSNQDRDKEQHARETLHELKYVPDRVGMEKNIEHYEVYSVVKKAWQDHCQTSESRPVGVYYVQEELGELLQLLEIPCMNIADKFKGIAFYSYGKGQVEIQREHTCGWPHDYGLPCQTTLSMR